MKRHLELVIMCPSSLDHSNICSGAGHMNVAPTSTNRPGGVWGKGRLQTRFKRKEVLKTESPARATPALRSSPKLKTQDERIRLGVGGSGDELTRGSQDESK